MYTKVSLEDMPRWYELSFLENHGPSILLKIHTSVIDELMVMLKEFEYLASLQETLALQDFCFDFYKQNIGFGGVLVNHGNGVTEYDHDFIVLSALIPRSKKETSNKCDTCDGKGTQGGEKCFFCNGTGKDWRVDYKQANAIAASFSILFHTLDLIRGKSSSKLFQFFDVQLIAGTRWGIFGGMSPALRLVHNIQSSSFPDVEEAMKKVWEKSFGHLADFEKDYFQADTRKGMLILNVPGDACGICPDHWEDESGYGFGDHNVDHPVHALTLLAGLAALHDNATKRLRR